MPVASSLIFIDFSLLLLLSLVVDRPLRRTCNGRYRLDNRGYGTRVVAWSRLFSLDRPGILLLLYLLLSMVILFSFFNLLFIVYYFISEDVHTLDPHTALVVKHTQVWAGPSGSCIFRFTGRVRVRVDNKSPFFFRTRFSCSLASLTRNRTWLKWVWGSWPTLSRGAIQRSGVVMALAKAKPSQILRLDKGTARFGSVIPFVLVCCHIYLVHTTAVKDKTLSPLYCHTPTRNTTNRPGTGSQHQRQFYSFFRRMIGCAAVVLCVCVFVSRREDQGKKNSTDLMLTPPPPPRNRRCYTQEACHSIFLS